VCLIYASALATGDHPLTHLLGIDIGTTGTKVLLVAADGTETKLGGAYDHFADGGA
jgi:hypothetical protein